MPLFVGSTAQRRLQLAWGFSSPSAAWRCREGRERHAFQNKDRASYQDGKQDTAAKYSAGDVPPCKQQQTRFWELKYLHLQQWHLPVLSPYWGDYSMRLPLRLLKDAVAFWFQRHLIGMGTLCGKGDWLVNYTSVWTFSVNKCHQWKRGSCALHRKQKGAASNPISRMKAVSDCACMLRHFRIILFYLLVQSKMIEFRKSFEFWCDCWLHSMWF